MSIEYGERPRLWGDSSSMHYVCGCTYKAGFKVCPVHNKPILEQMLYGNDNIQRIDESEYKQNKLNEGFIEGDY